MKYKITANIFICFNYQLLFVVKLNSLDQFLDIISIMIYINHTINTILLMQ